jgi:hypothetical protein
MSFALEENHTVTVKVRFDDADSLVGIRLDDGMVIYAHDFHRSDAQLAYAVDLLPPSIRVKLQDDLSQVFPEATQKSLASIYARSIVTHFDSLKLQTNALWLGRLDGWWIKLGDQLPPLTFFTPSLFRGDVEVACGSIDLVSPIAEVFLTSRAELEKS